MDMSKRKKELAEEFASQRERALEELERQKAQGLEELKRAEQGAELAHRQRAGSLATQFERNRRSFNELSAMNGLGTGSGTQAALEQRSAYLKSFAALQAQRAGERERSSSAALALREKYGRLARETGEKNDAALKAALASEEAKEMAELMKKAGILAQYGDFSAYGELYGKETADKMHETWLRKNPLLAYKMGELGADEYKMLTGKYPPGSRSYSGGGGGRKSRIPHRSKWVYSLKPKVKSHSHAPSPLESRYESIN